MLLQEIQDSLGYVKDQVMLMNQLIDEKQKEVPDLERQVRASQSLRAWSAR